MYLKSTPFWESDTVGLFLLEPSDVTLSYVSWLNDPVVNRHLESRFVTHTLESTKEFVRGCRENSNDLFLGIRSRELNQRHVGNIKLGPIDRQHGRGEIGILIGEREAWGHGIGSQAIDMLCTIAKNQLYLRKITAGCYGSNTGSERAFLKARFEIEGRRREHFMLDGKTEDLVLMARWLK